MPFACRTDARVAVEASDSDVPDDGSYNRRAIRKLPHKLDAGNYSRGGASSARSVWRECASWSP